MGSYLWPIATWGELDSFIHQKEETESIFVLSYYLRVLHYSLFLFYTPPITQLRHNHSIPLYHPACSTRSHLSSFLVNTAPLWNNLPSHLVDCTSSQSFKRGLKSLNDIYTFYLYFNCIVIITHFYTIFIVVFFLFRATLKLASG